MPEQIPLQAIPNQQVSITLDGNRFDLSLKSTRSSALISITRNDVLIIENLRIVCGSLLIPYEYLEEGSGNFLMDVPNDFIPYYTNFGVTQFLVYFSASDIEALRDEN